jgi:hypothetical protein
MSESLKKLPPFSLRLTLKERARLQAEAGRTPLGSYIRQRILETPCTRRRNFRMPVKDELALAAVLSALGQSRISSNLNQLAKAVHTGSLQVTPETEKTLRDACSGVLQIRQELVRALGLVVVEKEKQ